MLLGQGRRWRREV
ncbi:hypothetical protein E2C01_066950 [Portunus trituberculatus]|uniref:Uncharacterized protein n=1 Tax=Portunus trituberculatus TaxID=210409 RepID=A0A5B7HVA1_PORTR|nr:hypothetical protein [Portunus trituberculatus]